MSLADSTAEVVVCMSQIGNGIVGVVFEGLLICKSVICKQPDDKLQGKNVIADLSALKVKRETETFNLGELLEAAESVKKVAVKFNTKRAAEITIGSQLLKFITSLRWEKPFFAVNMREEIEHVKNLQGDAFVKYIATIEQVPDIKGKVSAEIEGNLKNAFAFHSPSGDNLIEEQLGAPGLVMEYIAGRTVDDVIKPLKSPEKEQMLACFLGQMVLAFGTEMSHRLMNEDLHARNAIVQDPTSGSFKLNQNISCPLIKVVDMGKVKPMKSVISSLTSLFFRIHTGFRVKGEDGKLADFANIPDELKTLIRRVLSAGGAEGRGAVEILRRVPGIFVQGESEFFKTILDPEAKVSTATIQV